MNRVSSSDETYGRSIRGHVRGAGYTRGHQQRLGRQRSNSPSMGRSSPASVDSHEASKTRMRWILSLGLLLPALAAIIGVVAWAVSAEVVMGTRREMARNNEMHKPSSEASYWLNHNRNKHSHEHVANDRIDEPSAEKMQFPNRAKPTAIKDLRKEFKNESLTSSKTDNSLTRNANIYFLAGLDSLSSSKMVSSEKTNVNSKTKKSTGAQVAEVIDRLVAQRKSVGSPHIVVVAPLSDSRKKYASTTTTTTPAPKSYSRDADTLLAAAQLLAAQHKIKALNRMDQDRMDQDYEEESDSNSNSNNKPSFESANLLNYDAPKQSDSNFVSVPPYQNMPQPVPPPQPPPHNPHPPQSQYAAASAPHPTYVSSNRHGFDSPSHQHLQQNMHSQPHPHGPPMSSSQHYRAPPPPNQPMPPPIPAHNMPPPYPVGPIAQSYSPHGFNGGFNSAASFNAPAFSSLPLNGPAPGLFNKNNRALVSFQSGDVGDNSYGHGHTSEGHASYEDGPGKGITLHFGGGPIGGGGQVVTSPIGIFKTLLLPLLPKPRVNLNGKVVFGVVLEKGVGFGKQKQIVPIPHHYKRR